MRSQIATNASKPDVRELSIALVVGLLPMNSWWLSLMQSGWIDSRQSGDFPESRTPVQTSKGMLRRELLWMYPTKLDPAADAIVILGEQTKMAHD